jgi:glycolate oxidase iron-sulfur subunit
MQTLLAEEFQNTAAGAEAVDILQSCVRCGFCTATCPTYQLLGDELDGPRGRIQLIKQTLEGHAPSRHTQVHLDRCLSCRACETTCPSGVRYGALLDIGRRVVDARVSRPWSERVQRWLWRTLLTSRGFGPLYRLGQALRRFLPRGLAAALQPRYAPATQPTAVSPDGPSQAVSARRVVLLGGCVQPAMAPNITAASRRVLARLGFEAVTVPAAACCGSVRQHLGDPAGALAEARRNIDAWWPEVERGAAALVSDASACGLMLKDYGRLLQQDERYAARASRIAALACDIADLVSQQLPALQRQLRPGRPPELAWHAPCTLQHGQRSRGVVEGILMAAGATLVPVADGHLCCGSAGVYAWLQPDISAPLRDRKLAALLAAGPQQILSANIGCIMHLAAAAPVPVRHWIEWLDERTGEST